MCQIHSLPCSQGFRMILDEMRYKEQRYPLRGEGQERGEYEFFISGLGTPIVKRFGTYIG